VTITTEAYTLTRMTGVLGARVDGLDLSVPLPEDTVASLRAALSEHCVLIFSGQGDLTAEQQIAFGKYWGELIAMPPDVDLVDGHAELFRIRTEPRDDDPHWHDDWHSDWTFLERPPFVSILAAKKLPDAGGDTMWASQYAAYERLSPRMQDLVNGLRAVHVRKKGGGVEKGVHPAVRTIPQTGRRALFVNEFYTTQFEDMTVEESAGLLGYLTKHATNPNFSFRHRWSPGDVAVWDNRCVQHYAVADYREERELHRLTIVGEIPEFH
jgi:taurine dioxygenase